MREHGSTEYFAWHTQVPLEMGMRDTIGQEGIPSRAGQNQFEQDDVV